MPPSHLHEQYHWHMFPAMSFEAAVTCQIHPAHRMCRVDLRLFNTIMRPWFDSHALQAKFDRAQLWY